MTFALITLTASLVLNVAVLALLKIGLRDAPRTGSAAAAWCGRQPC
ncbi:MAG: hypothetical protein SXG53_24560 [Pseudomonadota bacterium]|nr:hypothetical protein [Pseudomonadota bacterium]